MDRARTYPRRDVGRSFRFPLPSRMRVSFGDGHPTHPRRGSGTTSSAAWTSHSRSLEHERFRPSLSHRDFQAKISRFSAWEGSRFRSRSIEISREIDRDFEAEASRFQRGRDRDFEGKGSRFRERSEGTEGNEGDGETWSGIGRVRRKRWASKRRRRRVPSSAKGRSGGGGGRSVQLWWRGRGHNEGNGKEHPPKRTGSVQLVPGRHSDALRKVWLGNLVCQALQKDPRRRG